MKLWLALFFLISSPALAGWENGNAGDTYTAEFILTGRDLVERMKMLPPSELGEANLPLLAGVVLSTQVHSEEKLLLEGYEVDAINYPSQGKILISRARWRELRQVDATTQRLTLVLHEYLFMIGVDDHQFRVSGRLIPQLGIKDYNPNRWWNPLNPVNRASLDLVYRENDCAIAGLDFNLLASEEEVSASSTGDCGESFRRVSVRKSSLTAPPSSGARGTFHRYEILVSDRQDRPLGSFTYEPEWGQCLLPQDGSCRLSGKIFVGGVEFIFWLLR